MKFKRATAWTLVAFQILQPVAANAAPLMRIYVPDLVVTNGKPPPKPNIDPNNPSSEEVRAGSAVLKVSPSTIDFGSVRVGQAALAQTSRMINLGAEALTLGKISGSSTQFTVTDNCDGAVLRPMGVCDVNLQFAPTQEAAAAAARVVVPFTAGPARAEAVITAKGVATSAHEPVRHELQNGASGGLQMVNGRATLQFGVAIVPEQTVQRSFFLKSSAQAPLQFKGLTVRGDASVFAVSHDCPAALPVGERCEVNVTFAPKLAGPKAATLVLATNSHAGNDIEVDLLGEGLEVFPVMGADSTLSVDFGQVPVGSSAVVRDVTLSNRGTAPLNIDSTTLGAATGVSVVSNTCLGNAIAPNASCVVRLSMSGSTVATLDGTLTVVHNGRLTPASPTRIALKGAVVPQTRVLQYTTTVDFGIVDVGTSATATVTVKNTGNMPVSGINASASSPFRLQSHGCSATLAPDATCTLTYAVTPTVNGKTIVNGPISATGLTTPAPLVSFQVVGQTRRISMDKSSIAAGLAPSHLWTPAGTVNVKNEGNVALAPKVGGMLGTGEVSGYPWLRIVQNTCAQAIEPGASCSFGVEVKPTASGASYSAPLRVFPDASASAYDLPLTVSTTGTTQSLTWDLSELDFGNVGSLSSVERRLTITNTSPAGTVLTGLSSSVNPPSNPSTGTGVAVVSSCPTTLASGASCEFVLRMTGGSYVGDTPLALERGTFNFRYSGAQSSAVSIPLKAALLPTSIEVGVTGNEFGTVPVGVSLATAQRAVVTVRNTGAYAATMAPWSLGSWDPGTQALTVGEDVSVAGRCVASTPLNPGASCTYTFYPAEGSRVAIGEKTRKAYVNVVNPSTTAPAVFETTFSATLMAPAATTNVSALDFETVGERTSKHLSFTFSPSHGGSAAFESLKVTGAGYGVTPQVQCPQTVGNNTHVPHDAVCTVTVSYTPGAYVAGPQHGEVEVRFYHQNTSAVVARVALTAQVEAARSEVVANDLDFGVLPGQTNSSVRYAFVRNTSEKAAIQFSSSRTVAQPFVLDTLDRGPVKLEGVTVNNCVLTNTLAAGQACYVAIYASGTVRGNVATVGVLDHDVQLATNSAAGTVRIPLKATLLPAQIVHPAASMSFETPVVSTESSQDQAFVITNSGGGRAYPTGSFTTKGEFWLVRSNNVLTQSMTATSVTGSDLCYERNELEPGESCRVVVRFKPTGAAGARTGTFSAAFQEPATAAISVALSGTVLAGSAEFSATTLDMGDVLVGQEVRKTFEVFNAGEGPMALREIMRKRTDGSVAAYPTDFTLTHDCPASLPAQTACTLEVTFKPDRNFNWRTVAQKEAVQLEHFSSGAWQRQYVSLLGIASGSYLTADVASYDLGNVDRGPVPANVYSQRVTFTASGQAPVRLWTVADGDRKLVRALPGSCRGITELQPGQSCDIAFTNLDTYASHSLGVNNVTETLMYINGSFVDATGKLLNDRSVSQSFKATLVSPMTIVEVTPRAVPTSSATEAALVGSGFRDSVEVTLAGQPVSATYVSAGVVKLALPAGLASGSHTLRVRNTDGIAQASSASFQAADFDVADAGTASVSTYSRDRPAGYTVIDAAVLANGSIAHLTSAGQVHITRNGVLTGSYSYGLDSGYSATYAMAASGNTVFLVGMARASNGGSQGCTMYECTFTYTAYVKQQVRALAVNANGVPLQVGAADTMLHDYRTTAIRNHNPALVRSVSVYGVNVGTDGSRVVVATSFSVVGGSENTQKHLAVSATFTGNMFGTMYQSALPSDGSQRHVLGVAVKGNYAFVRQGSSVTSFRATATGLVDGTQYLYTSSLGDASARGLAVGTGGELLVPCYANSAVCVIAEAGGALGTANPLAGAPGTLGYKDGNFSAALVNVLAMTTSPHGASFLQQGMPAAVRVVQR